MYPAPFRYHRASSLEEAASMLKELGDEAKLLAGGQSLIPLMKLRLAAPSDLVDLNFISGLDGIEESDGQVRFGPLARHTSIAESAPAGRIPILADCAGGIADVQVRNRGTIGGSVAEADPSGDWTPVLLTLSGQVVCQGPKESRTVPLAEFIEDAYSTVLAPGELIREIRAEIPPKGSGGAYLAFKRSAQVYATASAAVQLTMKGDTCSEVHIVMGSVGLTAVRAKEAEDFLRGKAPSAENLESVAEAAMAATEPLSDVRGSSDFKKTLVRALVKRAAERAVRRAGGEQIEGSHEYV
jgi:carbon-monoxide dehydrogenase medium subunit